MAEKYIHSDIEPSKRVQIVKTNDRSPHPYWKAGQFGYAVGYSTHPGMYTESGPSRGGELSYLVSKSKDGHTGASWFSAEALRFTGKEKRPGINAHSRKKKLNHHEAKQLLQSDGINFRQDFHELSSSEVQRVLEIARLAGYRKRSDAPGSTARMYYQFLSRLK
jgi:hypothetical protein